MKTVVHTLSISFAKTRCAGAPRLCVSILGVLVLVPVVVFAEAPLAVPVDGDPFHGKLTSIDAHWKLGFLAGGGAPGRPAQRRARVAVACRGRSGRLGPSGKPAKAQSSCWRTADGWPRP